MRLATCALVLLLGACAHVDRKLDADDGERKPVAHITLVVCLFASCHHIAQPADEPDECSEPD